MKKRTKDFAGKMAFKGGQIGKVKTSQRHLANVGIAIFVTIVLIMVTASLV